jgi:hypothetical protein
VLSLHFEYLFISNIIHNITTNTKIHMDFLHEMFSETPRQHKRSLNKESQSHCRKKQKPTLIKYKSYRWAAY